MKSCVVITNCNQHFTLFRYIFYEWRHFLKFIRKKKKELVLHVNEMLAHGKNIGKGTIYTCTTP